MTAIEAEASLQHDNDLVRVTQYTFPPGSETGHHVHEYAYVVVPTVGGTLTMVNEDGSTNQAELQAGVSYQRPAGVSHNVLNKSDATVVFVEVELKDHPLA